MPKCDYHRGSPIIKKKNMASFLNKYGIAVRSGNHCAQPMLRRLGYDSVIRFSPAFYNTKEEIEVIGDRMEKIISFLKKW